VGSQGGVFITTVELEEGNPQEPPMSCHEFIFDDNFVKSRAFYQFAWRKNIGLFEETCSKLKTKHPEMEEVDIQNQIKEEMMQEFKSLILEERRQMIKASKVFLLPNWILQMQWLSILLQIN